jgi:hypothetical protein
MEGSPEEHAVELNSKHEGLNLDDLRIFKSDAMGMRIFDQGECPYVFRGVE